MFIKIHLFTDLFSLTNLISESKILFLLIIFRADLTAYFHSHLIVSETVEILHFDFIRQDFRRFAST